MGERMTWGKLYEVINEEAARVHVLNGQALRLDLPPLSSTYVWQAVEFLTELYQENFISLEEREGGKKGYVVLPNNPKPAEPKDYLPLIFEVYWLMAGLFGIALARQALAIHREPVGKEPQDSDERLLKIIHEFLERTPPEAALKKMLRKIGKRKRKGHA